jgi:hypothetical protein
MVTDVSEKPAAYTYRVYNSKKKVFSDRIKPFLPLI